MAWKELLQQEEGIPRPTGQDGSASRNKDGLIAQLCGETVPAAGEDETIKPDAEEEHVQFADGYVRRSPVQKYRTAPDFTRKRIRKAIVAVVVIGLIVLLGVALLKSGLIKLS